MRARARVYTCASAPRGFKSLIWKKGAASARVVSNVTSAQQTLARVLRAPFKSPFRLLRFLAEGSFSSAMLRNVCRSSRLRVAKLLLLRCVSSAEISLDKGTRFHGSFSPAEGSFGLADDDDGGGGDGDVGRLAAAIFSQKEKVISLQRTKGMICDIPPPSLHALLFLGPISVSSAFFSRGK